MILPVEIHRWSYTKSLSTYPSDSGLIPTNCVDVYELVFLEMGNQLILEMGCGADFYSKKVVGVLLVNWKLGSEHIYITPFISLKGAEKQEQATTVSN